MIINFGYRNSGSNPLINFAISFTGTAYRFVALPTVSSTSGNLYSLWYNGQTNSSVNAYPVNYNVNYIAVGY